MKSSRSGQTLVEVMIALFVLVTGFLGILSLLAQSIFLSKTTSSETTATYLASEGIELAKNVLDHDVYQHLAGLSTGWAQGSPDTAFGSTGGDFELDYTICSGYPEGTPCGPLSPNSDCQSDFLYYDALSHTYLYPSDDLDPTTPTGFTRCIRVTPDPSNPNEITVQSIVWWNAGLATENVILEDHFYNWNP